MNNSFKALVLVLLCSCNNTPSDKISTIVQKDTSKAVFSETLKREMAIEDTEFKFNTKYNFSSFRMPVYTKNLAAPNFRNNPFTKDKEYINFIKEGCFKNGINFGGHYTLIKKGCGTMCELIFIVDRISGKIYTKTKPNDGRYGFSFQKDSRLLIANSNSFIDDSLKTYTKVFGIPELYIWKVDDFKRIQ